MDGWMRYIPDMDGYGEICLIYIRNRLLAFSFGRENIYHLTRKLSRIIQRYHTELRNTISYISIIMNIDNIKCIINHIYVKYHTIEQIRLD